MWTRKEWLRTERTIWQILFGKPPAVLNKVGASRRASGGYANVNRLSVDEQIMSLSGACRVAMPWL